MLPEWVTGVIALTLNSGAYYAEIIRSGIQAIHFGQIYRHGLSQVGKEVSNVSAARPYWPYQTVRNVTVVWVVVGFSLAFAPSVGDLGDGG